MTVQIPTSGREAKRLATKREVIDDMIERMLEEKNAALASYDQSMKSLEAQRDEITAALKSYEAAGAPLQAARGGRKNRKGRNANAEQSELV